MKNIQNIQLNINGSLCEPLVRHLGRLGQKEETPSLQEIPKRPTSLGLQNYKRKYKIIKIIKRNTKIIKENTKIIKGNTK